MNEPEPETLAILTIDRVLEPLPVPAVKRVLKYAEDRWASEPMPDWSPTFMADFTRALAEAAREIGDMRPIDVLAAAQEMARWRREHQEESNGKD